MNVILPAIILEPPSKTRTIAALDAVGSKYLELTIRRIVPILVENDTYSFATWNLGI